MTETLIKWTWSAQTLRLTPLVALAIFVCACATAGQVTRPEETAGSDVVSIVDRCGILDGTHFAGRVVYRGADGSLRPIRDVSFERHGQAGFITSGFSPKPVQVNRKGEFDFPVMVGVEGKAVKTDGQIQESEVTEQVSFTLRASGCNDLRVPFRPGQAPVTLEMSCPGRPSGQETAFIQ